MPVKRDHNKWIWECATAGLFRGFIIALNNLTAYIPDATPPVSGQREGMVIPVTLANAIKQTKGLPVALSVANKIMKRGCDA